MGFRRIGELCGALIVMLAASLGQGVAHSSLALTGKEINQVFKGKTCTTKGGATFTFSDDGRYAYSGLWQNGGRYSIEDGAISVALESGLERSFAISRRRGVLYMEQTAIACEGAAAKIGS